MYEVIVKTKQIEPNPFQQSKILVKVPSTKNIVGQFKELTHTFDS